MNIEQERTLFHVGGSLPKTFPMYIKRKADLDLIQNIENGNFCYILTARQMGKSSLRVHNSIELEKKGYACSVVDITKIGSKSEEEKWYFTFLYEITRTLNITKQFLIWWKAKENLSITGKFFDFFLEFLLKEIEKPIVLFIDEIDSIKNIDSNLFSSDDFFAVLRAVYNSRVDYPQLNRLMIVIIGVAAPSNLIEDTQRTPFNIGVSIKLTPFELNECKPFVNGLAHINTDHEKLFAEIHAWTNGQPFLTQRLCDSIANRETEITNVAQTVQKHVNDLFININTDEEPNLSNVQKRIIRGINENIKMLSIYRNVLNKENVKVNNSDTLHIELKLSGIVIERQDILVVANKIYATKFNDNWCLQLFKEKERPFASQFNVWKQNKTDKNTALRGILLEQSKQWEIETQMASQEEKAFLDFSDKVIKEELEKENDLKDRELDLAAKTAKLRQRTNFSLAILLLIVIAVASWGYYISNKEKKKLEEDKKELEIEKNKLTITTDSLKKEGKRLKDTADILNIDVEKKKKELDSITSLITWDKIKNKPADYFIKNKEARKLWYERVLFAGIDISSTSEYSSLFKGDYNDEKDKKIIKLFNSKAIYIKDFNYNYTPIKNLTKCNRLYIDIKNSTNLDTDKIREIKEDLINAKVNIIDFQYKYSNRDYVPI